MGRYEEERAAFVERMLARIERAKQPPRKRTPAEVALENSQKSPWRNDKSVTTRQKARQINDGSPHKGKGVGR